MDFLLDVLEMKINNQILFTGCITAGALMTGCSVEKERPNILCIVCEDISPLLGCYGDTLAYTPNIDKLASEGVRFTNVFSVSGVSALSRPFPFGCGCGF